MVDRDFGNWLAGFIDGEGCFYITSDSARAVRRPRFSLTLRSDDRPILEQCQAATGLGTLHNYFAQSGAQVTRWMIQSHKDCEGLVALLDVHPLRAKKRRDFELWRRAVVAARSIRPGRANNSAVQEQLMALKAELAEIRRDGIIYATH